MLNDATAKAAYDKGYDAGVRARTDPDDYVARNPYRQPSRYRNRYYQGDSRYDFWERGCRDGWEDKPRKMSQAEAEAREMRGAALLKAIYEAAYELDVCEDFEMMPCQHSCCAPADWNAYQATRQQLHDAIAAYRDHLGIDPWLGAVPAATTADATGSEAPR